MKVLITGKNGFIGKNLSKKLNYEITNIGREDFDLTDSKLRALGWEPKAIFDEELPLIVNYYKDNFIW